VLHGVIMSLDPRKALGVCQNRDEAGADDMADESLEIGRRDRMRRF
jgi:hypothetical protein